MPDAISCNLQLQYSNGKNPWHLCMHTYGLCNELEQILPVERKARNPLKIPKLRKHCFLQYHFLKMKGRNKPGAT